MNLMGDCHARVAQWLEHWSSKPGVVSSILSSGIKYFFSLFLFWHSFAERPRQTSKDSSRVPEAVGEERDVCIEYSL